MRKLLDVLIIAQLTFGINKKIILLIHKVIESWIEKKPFVTENCLGKMFASEFLPFERKFDRLPDLNLILSGNSSNVNFDFDVLYFVCLSLIKKLDNSNKENILSWVNNLPAELKAFFYTQTEQVKKEIIENTSFYSNYLVENQNAFKF